MEGKFFGSGALPGKMLLVRIIENSEIDAYFRSDKVNFAPQGQERIRIVPRSVRGSGSEQEKTPFKFVSIILDPALNQKVYLIQINIIF